MNMTRKEFWQWMALCPAKEGKSGEAGWFVAEDNGTEIRVFFWFDEENDEDDADGMTFMYQGEVIEKFGHLVEASSDDWDAFLNELRGLTYVESKDDGYIVQEIEHDNA